VIVLAYGGYHFLETDLLPAMDEGGFILDYIMPAGSSARRDEPCDSPASRRFFDRRPRSRARRDRTGLQLGLAAVTEAEHRRHRGEAEAESSRASDRCDLGGARKDP